MVNAVTMNGQWTTAEEKWLLGDKRTAEFFDELLHVAAIERRKSLFAQSRLKAKIGECG